MKDTLLNIENRLQLNESAEPVDMDNPARPYLSLLVVAPDMSGSTCHIEIIDPLDAEWKLRQRYKINSNSENPEKNPYICSLRSHL